MTAFLAVITLGYVGLWLAFRRVLPLHEFPFFWALFWATTLLNVVGSFWLLSEKWVTPSYLGGLVIVLVALFATACFNAAVRRRLRLRWPLLRVEWRRDEAVPALAALVVSLSLVSSWIALNGPPLLLSAGGGVSRTQLIAMRTAAQFGEGQDFHWFRLGFYVIPIILAVCAYARLSLRRTVRRHVIFSLALGYAALTSLAFLNKTPILVLLLSLGLGHLMIEKKIELSRLLVAGGIAVMALVSLYVVYTPEFLAQERWYTVILDRVFLAYARSGAIAFSVWPDSQSFLDGTTIVNPGGLMPYESIALSRIIYQYAYPFAAEAGNAPAPAFAEGWVNFGWPGVSIAALLSCILTVVAQLVFRRLPKSPLVLGILAVVVFDMASLAMNSLFFSVLEPTRLILYATLIGLASITFRRRDLRRWDASGRFHSKPSDYLRSSGGPAARSALLPPNRPRQRYPG